MPISALLKKNTDATKNTDALDGSASASRAPDDRRRLMAEFDIAYNGRHYEYDAYRYDHLTDAVNYARLQRSMGLGEAEAGSRPSRQVVGAPDDAECRLMAELVITYKDGVFHFGTFRYDRLVDAVNYARLHAHRDASCASQRAVR